MNPEEYEDDEANTNDSDEIVRDDDPDVVEEIDDGVGFWLL